MAFPKKLIDLLRIALTLMVLTLPSIAANIDCNGKSFHCLNSTHFMICVDFGSGVSITMDDFVIPCPPPTVCQRTNNFECDFPVETSITVAPTVAQIVTSVSETIDTVTTPYELTTSVPIEQYFDTSTTTTLSEDVLTTHQTIAVVTESTTQLETDVTQNNEVIIPLNETIPSVELQNDLKITTTLPNNISIDTTETIPDAFENVSVTVPKTELNLIVTENILSADVVHNDLSTASTLPNNISASALDVFPVETEKVNITTHEFKTNLTLNETIQSATEIKINEQFLYTSSDSIDLPSETTEIIPSLNGIQTDVTTLTPLPIHISANITGLTKNTTETINVITSGSEINSIFSKTDPSAFVDIVTTVLPNNGSNITDLIKNPAKYNTLLTPGVESILNLSDIVESTTESIQYNMKESIPSTPNDLSKLIPNNSSINSTDNFLGATEKVKVIISASELNTTLNETTRNVNVVQHEPTTLTNMSDYVTDLIPNVTETIEFILPAVTVQTVIDVAQNEPTLLSTSNNALITSNGTNIDTESIITEVTKLSSNKTYLDSDSALPFHINDTTAETILNNVSETILNIDVQSDLLPENSSVNTTDDSKMNSNLDETTPKFQSDTAQNELTYYTSTSSTVMSSPVTETITEVLTEVTEMTPNVPASEISLNVDEVPNVNILPLSNKLSTEATYLTPNATDNNMTARIPESAIEYFSNATTPSVDVGQNDSQTPLPSINSYKTALIVNTTENSDVTITQSTYYSSSNETIRNKTFLTENEHTLLLNLSSSTALPDKLDVDTEPTLNEQVQILSETTSSTYFKQINYTTTFPEHNTLSAAELILGVTEHVSIPGPETYLSKTTRSESFVQNETTSITLPIADLTDTTKSVNVDILEPERNLTLNVTVPRAEDIVHNYSNTLNSFTLPKYKANITTESILDKISRQSSNSSLSSNERKVENENIVPNNIQQKPYAQNTTVSKPIKIEPSYNDNAINSTVNEMNKANSTTKVSMNSSASGIIIESSTQRTDIRNDSYVQLNIIESVKGKPMNISHTELTTLSSLVNNFHLEIVTVSSINLDTTSNSVLVNQEHDFKKTDTYTIQKETSDIKPDYSKSIFQTELPTVRATEGSNTPAPVTGNALITDSATLNSLTDVNESYYERNNFENSNSDINTLTSVSAVIDVETTKTYKPILLFNSPPEPIYYGGHTTTEPVILSKSLAAQDTVSHTTINILTASAVPSTLEQKNVTASVQQESYSKTTINADDLQKTPSNEISTIKVIHKTQDADLLTDTVNTSAARNDFIQETKNLDSRAQVLGILTKDIQDTVLEKSNLSKVGQNQAPQIQDVKTNDKQTNARLDVLLNTPIHLMMSSQPTLPQTKYAAEYTPINTLSLDNLDVQPTDNYTFTKTDVTLDIKHGNGNETLFTQTMNVSRPSQSKKESPQISNSSLKSTVMAFPVNLDQDNVTSKQDIANNLTKKLSESWRATVVTKPYQDQDNVASKPRSNNISASKSSTESWKPTVVTEPHIDQDIVTSRQNSADIPTLKPSTEAWRALVVTKPDTEVTITPPPLIKTELTEPRGKLPGTKGTVQSASEQNEGKTVLQQRATNTSENEKPLIDVKSTTERFEESWSKGDGTVQAANKYNFDNSQSKQHVPTPTTEFNKPYPVTQETEQVITKAIASNIDMDTVVTDAVKTSVPLSIQSNSPTGTYLEISVLVKPPRKEKTDQSEQPEEIESVEQPERNEEQEISEYEESEREKVEEKLEDSENSKGEPNKVTLKTRKITLVNEYVNVDTSTQNKKRFENTVEMTTKKVEEPSKGQHKSITNIEGQPKPTIVKHTGNIEHTQVFGSRKHISKIVPGNVKNSTVSYSLSKSFARNTHNVSAPVSESAKSSFVCKLNSRGKFPDNNDCRKFYICIGKPVPIEGLCPNNTVFSELRKQCTKIVSHCVRNNQFQCVWEGRYSDYFNDNIYYICVKNNVGTFTRFKLQCQSGYHLNKTSVRCALNTESIRPTSQQSISDISKNSEQSVSSYRSEKLVVKSSNKFECKKEGKFPDPNNSRKYYVCSKKNGKSRFRLKRKKCDSDEIFHKDKKECVDAESYDFS